MNSLSVIGLSICLVYISIIMHGAEAGTCISQSLGKRQDLTRINYAAKAYVECTEEGCKSDVALAEKAKEATCGTCDACTTTFAGEVGLDREKYCSAANAYLECAKQDCTLDDIALAKAAQQGCGAGRIFVNLAVIGLGLTLYMLV